jgi:NAD(P)-dependent dehydrogenase (short-subunit alcohol dehydrogenase family)
MWPDGLGMRYSLVGKVALVTGAMRGIGLETARALHHRGASVTLLDRSAQDTAVAAAAIGIDRRHPRRRRAGRNPLALRACPSRSGAGQAALISSRLVSRWVSGGRTAQGFAHSSRPA